MSEEEALVMLNQSQVLPPCGSEDDFPPASGPTVEVVPQLKRVKRTLVFDDDSSSSTELIPDIAAYLDAYEVPEKSRIGMCRTYANYLAQKLKATK